MIKETISDSRYFSAILPMMKLEIMKPIMYPPDGPNITFNPPFPPANHGIPIIP